MTDNQAYVRIGEFIESHPSEAYSELAGRLGLTRSQVARIARLRGIKRRPGKRRAALEAAGAAIEAAAPQPGSVPTGEAAAPPTEEPICAAPDAPPMEATLLSTPATPPAGIAVV